MDKVDASILQRALQREKKARKAAEQLLEQKSKELYDASLHLKETNGRLETLLNKGNGSHLDLAFANIIDPYVVMDMTTRVINMNSSAKEFLGFDHKKEEFSLSNLVHPDYFEYTATSFKTLMNVGIIKNYNVRIFTKNKGEKFVNINASLIYDEEGNPIAAQGVIRDITREYEIKQLLEDQKKQQDIIVENSSLGIVLIVDDKIVKANKTFCELLGYSEIELQKMGLNDISIIEDVKLYEDLLQDNKHGNSDKFSLTRKFFKRDQSTLYGKTSVSTVRNDNGEIAYKVAMIEDITKDKLSKERLRASEERLSKLLGNLQNGILLEDEDRRLVLTNQKFCDMFGIKARPENLKSIDCEKALEKFKNNFKEPETMLNRVNHVLDKKDLVLSDELELADGRTFERDYIPLFIDDVYKGHLWSYTDVTMAKNYRRSLEIQKEKYSSIIANMNLGLAEIDNEGKIVMVNNRYAEMIDKPIKKLIGAEVISQMEVDEENSTIIKQQFEKRKQNRSDSYEVTLKKSNGEQQYWLISGAPNYDERGNVIGSIGVHLDVTKQKLLELKTKDLVTELEASNKSLQEYAHIVSHDLKSPLRSVSALATWLYDDYKDKLDESGRYNLQMMLEKVEGMDKLISGILKYSTVNSDAFDNTDVDVNQVIQEITEIIFIPDHVTVTVNSKLPTILADKTKVHQLFQNFLSNAVVNIDKAKGVVAVDYQETPTHWQFSVSDNGVGIPKEYHEKIFQIFQSIGNHERSTGIGLSIVKKIIDRYEGHVWLESEVGEGTTFFFTIKKSINQ